MYRGGNIMIKKGYITLVFSILLLFLGTLLINIKNNTLTNEKSNKITINNIIKYAIKVNIRERHPYFVQMS